MRPFHYARVSLAASAYSLLASPIAFESDDGEAEVLAGTDFYAEAFLTEATRDAALGEVSGHIEFVVASGAEVDAIEYPTASLAIGPMRNSDEFAAVSAIILPAILEQELDFSIGCELTMNVTINRVQYLISVTRDGQPISTTYFPLHHQTTGEEHQQTAKWLADYFSNRLRATSNHDAGDAAGLPSETNSVAPRVGW